MPKLYRLAATALAATLAITTLVAPESDARRGGSSGGSRGGSRGFSGGSGRSSGSGFRSTTPSRPSSPARNTAPTNRVRSGSTSGGTRTVRPTTPVVPVVPRNETTVTPKPSAVPTTPVTPPAARTGSTSTPERRQPNRPNFILLDLEIENDEDEREERPQQVAPTTPPSPPTPPAVNTSPSPSPAVSPSPAATNQPQTPNTARSQTAGEGGANWLLILAIIAGGAVLAIVLFMIVKGLSGDEVFVSSEESDLGDDRGSVVSVTVAISSQYSTFRDLYKYHERNAEVMLVHDDYEDAVAEVQELMLHVQRAQEYIEYASVSVFNSLRPSDSERQFITSISKAERSFDATGHRNIQGVELESDSPFVLEADRTEEFGAYWVLTFVFQTDYNEPPIPNKLYSSSDLSQVLGWCHAVGAKHVGQYRMVFDPADGPPISQDELLEDYGWLVKL